MGFLRIVEHQEVKIIQLRAYSFLVEGALELSMVSTTLDGRPETTSLSPSQVRPTASIALGGVKNYTLCLRQRVSPDWKPKEASLEEVQGPSDRNQGFFHIIKALRQRALLCSCKMGCPSGKTPRFLTTTRSHVEMGTTRHDSVVLRTQSPKSTEGGHILYAEM